MSNESSYGTLDGCDAINRCDVWKILESGNIYETSGTFEESGGWNHMLVSSIQLKYGNRMYRHEIRNDGTTALHPFMRSLWGQLDESGTLISSLALVQKLLCHKLTIKSFTFFGNGLLHQ